MIKRAHVRQFLALVDTGGFTAAATKLGLTQPTLSNGITELERLIGTPLFVRERRNIRLTEAGGRLLPIARNLERGFRLADGINRSAQPAWPDLRLGMIRSIAPAMFRRILAAPGPEVQIELTEGSDADLRAALAATRIDIAVTLLRPGEAGAHVAPLLSEGYAMMVPAAHPLSARGRVRPDELARDIMIARRACEVLQETSRFFTQAGVRPRFALRSDSDERCMAMVAAGQGITTAPLSFAAPGICPVAIDGYDLRRTVGLLCRAEWLDEGDNAARFAAMAAAYAPAAGDM